MNIASSRSHIGGISKFSDKIRPGLAFGLMIFGALIAFEAFNYSTTDYALRDLLGDLKFMGIRWATILAIAFNGIDFAGIARIFTPEQGRDEPKEVWYLFGAWLLAATMNAVLTWWGVSMAIVSHTVQSSAVIPSATLTKVVPVFVAIMVWVIRILIIGSLSVSGDRIFSDARTTRTRTSPQPSMSTINPITTLGSNNRQQQVNRTAYSRPAVSDINISEPTYHSLNATASPRPTPRTPVGDRPSNTYRS